MRLWLKSRAQAVEIEGMPGDLALFYVALGLMVTVIAAFIARAVRLTQASLRTASRHVDLTNPDVARSVADEIRRREIPCPRCGGETFALLGTGNRYECEICHLTLTGPAHIPGSSPQDEPVPPS
jgi:ribosomal protein S27AE